jgi:hypothetical protein
MPMRIGKFVERAAVPLCRFCAHQPVIAEAFEEQGIDIAKSFPSVPRNDVCEYDG